jgi:D-alanyl-D-alanine dipeptidase
MILYNAMIKVGFSNISREYWHYSYGDGNWASKRKKKIAIYGIPKINK